MPVRRPEATSRAFATICGRLLPAKAVCERYQVVDRTLDNWLANEALGFPSAVYINRRRYWNEGELVEFERRQVGRKPKAA